MTSLLEALKRLVSAVLEGFEAEEADMPLFDDWGWK